VPEKSEMPETFDIQPGQPADAEKKFTGADYPLRQNNNVQNDDKLVVDPSLKPREYMYYAKKIMPKPIPLALKVQTLNEQVDVRKAKRRKAICHKKRKHFRKPKYQRQATADEALCERKILDGFLLLHSCRVKNPQQAVKSKLVGENIVEVEEGDLLFFPNLTYLNISENRIRLEQLVNLKSLRELYIQYNFIKALQLEPGSFMLMEILSLGFNSVPAGHILQLAQLPVLRVLDLSGNELCILPEDLSAFTKLEDLNLSSNNFSSDSVVVEPGKQFKSLSTIVHLKRLNLSHNALKGSVIR
jgi:Leucine-rich repeat (LRR) protein